MRAFLKRKEAQVLAAQDLQGQLRYCEDKRQFFLEAVRVLLHFIKAFALDSREIDSKRFRDGIDRFTEKLAKDIGTRELRSPFETQKRAIHAHILRQKSYLQDRENEFRDIIDLLTRGIVSLDSENQQYYKKIYNQSEKMEEITYLEDIRKIKSALADEIEQMRRSLQDKQDQDSQQMQKLSQKVSALSLELNKAKEASMRDGLTGVYNRKAFDHHLKALVDKNVNSKASFALLLLDIDDFKLVNDTYGHVTGDRVILSVARKCCDMVRQNDVVARYGGEEFAVILPDASLRNGVKRAKVICKTIAATRYTLEEFGQGTTIKITVSIGISAFSRGDTPQAVIQRADKALYAAKKAGKNRVVSAKP